MSMATYQNDRLSSGRSANVSPVSVVTSVVDSCSVGSYLTLIPSVINNHGSQTSCDYQMPTSAGVSAMLPRCGGGDSSQLPTTNSVASLIGNSQLALSRMAMNNVNNVNSSMINQSPSSRGMAPGSLMMSCGEAASGSLVSSRGGVAARNVVTSRVIAPASQMMPSRCTAVTSGTTPAGPATVLLANSQYVSVAGANPEVLLPPTNSRPVTQGSFQNSVTAVQHQQYEQTVSRTVPTQSLGVGGSPSVYLVQQSTMSEPTVATTYYDSITSTISSVNFLNIPLREDYSAVNDAVEVKAEETPPPCTSSSAVEEEEEPEPDGEIDIQIRNVVCNYTLPLHIDLHRVALHSGNVTFDRGRGVLLKQKRNPSCYVKVYSSGKIYIVGCRSESECKRAARGVARMVQKQMGRLGDLVRIRNYRVCNVLATCKMPFGIKIEELALKYPERSQYEPELSVGLVWRSTDPKATLRIHTTGSITVTGAVSEEAVMRAIELIYPIVKEFRCAQRHKDATLHVKRKSSKKSYGEPATKKNLCSSSGNSVTETSGVIGNRVYFSDEDDEFADQDDY